MPEREQAAINPAPVVADLQQRTAAGIDHHPGRVGIVEAAPPHGEKGAFECPIRALAFLDWVQASPPRQGFGPVQVAGDPERRMRVERSEQGVPVDAITWHEILAAAGRLGVDGGEVQRLAIGWAVSLAAGDRSGRETHSSRVEVLAEIRFAWRCEDYQQGL